MKMINNIQPEYRTGYVVKITSVEDPSNVWYVGQGTIDYHVGIIGEKRYNEDLNDIRLYKCKGHALKRMEKIINFEMFIGSYGFWNHSLEYVWIDREGNIA